METAVKGELLYISLTLVKFSSPLPDPESYIDLSGSLSQKTFMTNPFCFSKVCAALEMINSVYYLWLFPGL